MYLNEDMNYEVMLRLDYDSALQFCQSNSTIQKICQSPQFWQDKIPYDENYIFIKQYTNNIIHDLENKRLAGLHIEHFPSIEYMLPKRILSLIQNDTIVNNTNNMISIYNSNNQWIVQYNEKHPYYQFNQIYPVTLNEVTNILMNAYYYSYNNDIELNFTD